MRALARRPEVVMSLRAPAWRSTMPSHEPKRGSVLISGVGASQGLGAAIARRFSREGYPVVIAGRTEAKLSATLKELKDAGAKAAMAVGDSTSAADVARFVDERSEERRVGKECRSRWSAYHEKEIQ